MKRWSFEHNAEGWTSPDAPVTWSHLKAKDDGWSLKVDVAFPDPASLLTPVGFDVDGVGEILYHVYVPDDAPEVRDREALRVDCRRVRGPVAERAQLGEQRVDGCLGRPARRHECVHVPVLAEHGVAVSVFQGSG